MRLHAKASGIFAALAVAAAGISQGAAHHSASMFDSMRNEVLKGKVAEVRWVNPHVTLIIRGTHKSGEAPSHWLMETTSPGNLTRIGAWRRDAIKPGDEVEVLFHPLREGGKKHGLLRQLTLLATGDVFAGDIRDQARAGLE